MIKGNVVIIHGGGLVDPSKLVLMRIAKNLCNVYEKVFIGKYSFEALINPEFLEEYDENLVQLVQGKRGTFFGTSRGIDLTDPIFSNIAVSCLKERNIRTVIIAGGDGSSRQAAEISNTFFENDINIIFAIPLTIDGINGGLSIGINEAANESIRQIENITSTALQTRSDRTFGVVMVELQGRNRDDILANVLRFFCMEEKIADFNLSDILLRVVPANFETDEEKLVNEINCSSKRTLILVSEGAKIKIEELTKKINRKVRSLVVGYPSQSNNMTTKQGISTYNIWIDRVCSIIKNNPYESYSIVNRDGRIFLEKPIEYYARLNPRESQKAELPDDLKKYIIQCMSK